VIRRPFDGRWRRIYILDDWPVGGDGGGDGAVVVVVDVAGFEMQRHDNDCAMIEPPNRELLGISL